MISSFFNAKTPMLQIITIIANRNKLPPSPCTSIPKNKICDNIAPAIMPNARIAPYNDVRGMKSKTPAINSMIPVPILPHGSIPKIEKIWTLTGAAVNLKYNVCKSMIAATILSNLSK